ncbi:aquaporin [Arthrobacter castelli]|uniref:aquaporin n=1 Tax=Arthrobacter castelli TaxID=271431 RepID=UPI000685DB79|nr:aquaporin [Arthrobacter castelli]
MAEKHPGTSAAPAVSSTGPVGSVGAAESDPLVRHQKKYGVLSRSAAEAFGAFVLVLGGVAVSMFGSQAGIPGALAFGLLFIAGIIAVGHISGGHFNPALTLGFAVAGRLSWKDVLPYIVGQVIGGAAAMGLLWVVLSGGPQQIAQQMGALFGSVSPGFGENSPSQFPLTSVLLLQVILTAVLAGVYLTATSGRANKALAPFAAGLTYAVVLQVSLPVSGGGVNPARSTATVVFADAAAAGQLWLFWVAPLAGAAIAGLLYRSFEPAPSDQADAGRTTATGGTAADSADSADSAGADAGTDRADADKAGQDADQRDADVGSDDAGSDDAGTDSAGANGRSAATGSDDSDADAAEPRAGGRHAEPGDEDEARNFFDGPGGRK